MPAAPPLIGTYEAPAVKRGQVVTCLYRDRDCKLTSFTSARIPWPRVQPIGQRGGSGLWVNDTLRKAIRTESAVALRHWFGVAETVVWRWRKAFGVDGFATTKGSKRANRAASLKGVAALKTREWTAAERRACSRRSKRLGLKPTGRWKGKEWTPEQLAFLGTDHDEAIAKKLKRTVEAIRSQRRIRKIPAYSGWPGSAPGWTDEELALLGTMPDAEVAVQINRTLGAVKQKRVALRILSHSGFTVGGGRAWTEEEVALLGTDRDKVIAKKIGRTRAACAIQRSLRGIPAYSGWIGGSRVWAKKELAILGTDTDEAVAKMINRTPGAVMQKRAALKIPTYHDRRRG